MVTTAHHNELMIDLDKKCTILFLCLCVVWNVIVVRKGAARRGAQGAQAPITGLHHVILMTTTVVC